MIESFPSVIHTGPKVLLGKPSLSLNSLGGHGLVGAFNLRMVDGSAFAGGGDFKTQRYLPQMNAGGIGRSQGIVNEDGISIQ